MAVERAAPIVPGDAVGLPHGPPGLAVKPPQRWRLALPSRLVRSWRANPGFLLGLVLAAAVAFTGVAAPLVAGGVDPEHQELSNALKPPGWADPSGNRHPLGTDHLGRDLFARLAYGARSSLMVGLTAALLAGILGVAAGVSAGYLGGMVDHAVVGLIDTQLAVPLLLLTVTVLGIFGHSLTNVILVLGATGWVPYARAARAEALAIRRREFVEASRALGSSVVRTMVRHVLPNVAPSAIVVATLMVARAILAETALSFLGLGLEPPTVSWGTMLADGRKFMTTAWWLATFPGLAIMLTVLSINLLGDWLRDVLDPRLKGL